MVCGQIMDQDDDMVVCPVCGAPHHRECWMNEGHCHYEMAHGTDLQWHPKEPAEEEHNNSKPSQEATDDTPYLHQTYLIQCPGCRKFVQCKKGDTTCPNCGNPLPQPNVRFDPTMRSGHASGDAGKQSFGEPIDGVAAAKLARVVMQRHDYYLPRFRLLKEQGTSRISWNWMAFLLGPYWLAFRKCYRWVAFAACFDLLFTILSAPILIKLFDVLPQSGFTYQQMYQLMGEMSFTSASMIAMSIGAGLLVLRAIFFGLFGNYIYKRECLKRVERLDALPHEESIRMVFRLSGISIFAPIITFYAVDMLQTLLLSFI